MVWQYDKMDEKKVYEFFSLFCQIKKNSLIFINANNYKAAIFHFAYDGSGFYNVH